MAGATKGWSRTFDDPIEPPNGRKLVTLLDAGEYIHSLPKATQQTPPWQNAIEALLLAVKQNGPTMSARIDMMQALKGERADEPK